MSNSRLTRPRRWAMAVLVPLALIASAPASGQQKPDAPDVDVQYDEDVPEWMRHLAPDPRDPAVQAEAERARKRVLLEQELHRLRIRYFHQVRSTERRQIGISLLRTYTDPFAYSSLLEVFENEKSDVRLAILDMLHDQRTEEADATLAWAAIFDDDAGFRAEAHERLIRRTEAVGGASDRVKAVLAEGLRRDDDKAAGNAAALTSALKLHELIPLLITAQVSGTGLESDRQGVLASIIIGTQQSFVADLQPVVADSAVAFDPTLGVVTEGVVLQVYDAVVVTFRTEVHNALVGLTSNIYGQPTGHLGYDRDAWTDWYNDEFRPFMAAKEAADQAVPTQAPARTTSGA